MNKQLLILTGLAIFSGCVINQSGKVVPDSNLFNKPRVNPDIEDYSITPATTFSVEEVLCREFRQTAGINGQIEILTGKNSCHQNNGEWKLIN